MYTSNLFPVLKVSHCCVTCVYVWVKLADVTVIYRRLNCESVIDYRLQHSGNGHKALQNYNPPANN